MTNFWRNIRVSFKGRGKIKFMQNTLTQFATLNKGRITFSCAEDAEGIVETTDAGIASGRRMSKAWRKKNQEGETGNSLPYSSVVVIKAANSALP